MNRQEVKRILELYRPGTADDREPEVAAALEQVRQNAELQRWFEQHCALQRALQRKFRELPVSAELKESILAQRKIIRPAAWHRSPVWLAAVALFAALATLTSLWLWPRAADGFADYQARMVSKALRQYSMDLVTNDMVQVREFMAARGAPADYSLTPGLKQLTLAGGGFLRWRGNAVSMVCFDRGDRQMLYLFVLPRGVLKDPPPPKARLSRIKTLQTASWSEGDKVYLLAGPEESEFDRKYL